MANYTKNYNLKDDVKLLAKDDVVQGVITEEQYKKFIGEEYAS